MSFFSNFFLNGFIKEDVGFKVYSIFLVGVAVAIFAIAFWPLIIMVNKTKDTSFLNKKMFILHGGAGLFFGLGALCGFISSVMGIQHLWHLVFINGMFTVHNLGVAWGIWRMLSLKAHNVKKAMEMGITEAEYCRNHALQDSAASK